MMATLRRFIALLLTGPVQTGPRLGARSRRKTGGRLFRITLKKLEFERAITAQKGSPAKRTGHTLLVAAQYSQKSPENNALFAIWLADFGAKRGLCRPHISFRGCLRSDRPRAALPRSDF